VGTGKGVGTALLPPALGSSLVGTEGSSPGMIIVGTPDTGSSVGFASGVDVSVGVGVRVAMATVAILVSWGFGGVICA
jgi:hypothetical protein